MKQHFFIFDRAGRGFLIDYLSKVVFIYLTSFLLLSSWTYSVQAKELFFEPSINIHTEYDDNIRLRSDDLGGLDKSAVGVITQANATVGVRSSRYDLFLDSQVNINRYESDFDLDSEDFKISGNSKYNITETSIFRLGGQYTQNTTLTSEFDENGTGLVQDNITREQWAITPEWIYFMTSSRILQISYSHSEVDYEEARNGSFVDFSIDNLTINLSEQWTESLRTFLSVSAMEFEVPDIGRETTEYTVNIGIDYQFSPTWTTSFSVGRRFTSTEIAFVGGSVSDDVQGLIFTFDIKKEFETGSVGISFNRSTSARGNGQLREQNSLSFRYSYNIAQDLQFFLNGGVNIDSNSGSQNNDNDRTYYNVRPTIKWIYNSNASISAGYQYRRQEFESSNNVAESNLIFLNLNYEWDKLSTQKY